jgi:NRDE-2, necessary for RNA interference
VDGDPFTSYRAITASEPRTYDSDSEHTDSIHGLTSEDEDGPGGEHRIHLTARQEAIKELEAILTRDSTQIDSWFSLVRLSIAESPITTKRGPVARAEISLGVLTRALDAHPQNHTSVRLRVSYLEAGEELWDKREQAHEWETALKAVGGLGVHLGNREMIWSAWLSWAMRTARNVDDFLSSFRRALAAFDFGEGEVVRIRLLWRLCVHILESGKQQISWPLVLSDF